MQSYRFISHSWRFYLSPGWDFRSNSIYFRVALEYNQFETDTDELAINLAPFPICYDKSCNVFWTISNDLFSLSVFRFIKSRIRNLKMTHLTRTPWPASRIYMLICFKVSIYTFLFVKLVLLLICLLKIKANCFRWKANEHS